MLTLLHLLNCIECLGLEDLYDGADALAASGIGAFDIMAYPYVSPPYQLSIYPFLV